MGLLWPGFVFLLGLLPLLIGVYIWMLRRRRRFVVRYSSLALVRAAQPDQSRLRRHLPFALFLVALASLIVALGRPVSTVTVPVGRTNILLALDVSRSMCATDIRPNRLEAAKAAARSFIDRQAAHTQIGIVAFAGFAVLIQPPTTDQETLQAAVASMTTARRTAIGSGLVRALEAIAEMNPDVAPVASDAEPGAAPAPAGRYVPDIVVLLTDGVSNTGPLPLDAAQLAADRGVRVYTIGFGTAENSSIPDCSAQSAGGDSFGGSFGFGGSSQFGGFRRGIDEVTLMQMAEMTGGKYYSAASAGELQKVFQELPVSLITRTEFTELSFIFAAIGALLAMAAIGLALWWHPLL